jgi:hypothetical protein
LEEEEGLDVMGYWGRKRKKSFFKGRDLYP